MIGHANVTKELGMEIVDDPTTNPRAGSTLRHGAAW